MEPLVGGCLCGYIRYRVTQMPGAAHSCSCRMCQRHTGALTALWVEVPAEAVVWTGPGGRPATYRSSAASGRAFCPRCGSSLGAIDDAPVVALLTGTFDTPSLLELKPAGHAHAEARPAWWHPDVDP